MSTVKEIKVAIQELPKEQQAELLHWINDWADDEWDQQIKTDLKSGRLDKLLDQVRGDVRSGNVREMP